jgi:DNA polymerase-3 subunit epsilon
LYWEEKTAIQEFSLKPAYFYQMYAVVDIETTGNHSVQGKITEVAIYLTDGKEVLDEFTTLLDPEIFIPSYITSLTGINNEMVRTAPRFEEVAEQIYRMLEGNIFVAHNVNFDFNFLKSEFARCGYNLQVRKLCSSRLSRKLLPGLKSYGLGSLCRFLNIDIYPRHRAYGDAKATVKLLHYLIASDNTAVKEFIKHNNQEACLPPNLDRKSYEKLPESPGCYYFLNQKGEVIYVGKAKNIKSRINSHFSSQSESQQRQGMINNLYKLDFELCGNELIALLRENLEIKRLWPLYNRAQKRVSRNYGIFSYEDRNGFLRFSIGQITTDKNPVWIFSQNGPARVFLSDLVQKFRLCPRLAGLQKSTGACFDHQSLLCDGACCGKIGPEIYNERVLKALGQQENTLIGSMAIIGKGRHIEENSLVLIESGRFIGFGFVESNEQLHHPEEFKRHINFYPDDPDVYRILKMYLSSSHKDQVVVFQDVNKSYANTIAELYSK